MFSVVTYGPVEFEKQPVEAQNFWEKIANHFRGVYGRYLELIKGKNRKITTCT